ncbi:hypothetical protein BT96DRAFT_985939 [Gymnopus androsaceus JB14]|uniref:BRCT domain-containing protein n=1 Tax=Gymnopus androsaceus JB14 TaxID=1447944 RepID=A0A6A4IHF0_9AGAR|nr:hypothetical protein BT96DRAFT_985939 [Gymnopus androsaceus JB14]
MDDSTAESSAPKIFVDPYGRPLQIFIDHETLLQEPQLVRQLKRHGGFVSPSPQTAQYILATESPSLPKFDLNPEQSVLDCSWIQKCIKANRLLLEKDNWGGCGIQDHEQDFGSNKRQSLPPRHTRQRPSAVPLPDSNTTSSKSSSSPDPSPAYTAEPSLEQNAAYAQQNPHPYGLGGYIPSSGPGLMASSYGQTATPFNPQLMAQMFSDPVQKQNFYMALADIYRASMEAQTKNLAHAAFPNNAAQYQSLPSRSLQMSVSSRPPSAASTPSPSSAKGKRRATSPGPHVSGSSTPVFIRKGASVVFYVQVDLSQRHDIVNKIKKNGGAISTDSDSADYAILSTRSKMFPTLFRIAIASKTPVINPSFVYDSIEKGKLLPPTSKYLVEAPQKFTKQQLEDYDRMKETKVKASRKPAGARAATVKVEKEQKAVKQRLVSATNKTPPVIANRPPSPPLPPAHTRVMVSAGKYLYSTLEREYVATYAKVLLERDHEMSLGAMAQKLHEKMPHHPVRSWNTMISGQLREVIELARKRAGIAYRKNLYKMEKDAQQQPAAPERDLQLVAQFFADGGANGHEDDDDDNRSAIWERLHEKGNWRTPSSWENFYDTFHVEIKRRFNETTGQEAEE